MVSYFVRYEGEPESLQRFVHHYVTSHIPILQRFPGIVDVIVHIPAATTDPLATGADRAFFMAQMIFRSSEALTHALNGDERLAARADMACFPAFRGAVSHQAFATYGVLQGDLARAPLLIPV